MEDDKSPDAFRTITEVSRWLDTPAHVLRFWESRFPEISPVKRAGGRRYYRPEDMQVLGGIKTMLHDQGKSIRDVQELLAENGVDGISALCPAFDFAVPTTPEADTGGRLTLGTNQANNDAPAADDNHVSDPPAPEAMTEPDAAVQAEPEVAELVTELDPEIAAEPEHSAPAQDIHETEAAADPFDVSETEAPVVPNVPDTPVGSNPEVAPLDTAQDAVAPEAETGPDREAMTDPVQPPLFPDETTFDAPAPSQAPSGFRTRRTRSKKTTEPSDTDTASPIRGFFFNDLEEPALGADDDGALSLTDDDDDVAAFAGFSALSERAAAPVEPPDTLEEDDPEAASPAHQDPPSAPDLSLTDLPKDPPADMVWPAPPQSAAILRSLTAQDMIARVGPDLTELSERLHALHDRMDA